MNTVSNWQFLSISFDPQGRIYRQFDGNEWTPQQLTDAVLKAARVRAQP